MDLRPPLGDAPKQQRRVGSTKGKSESQQMEKTLNWGGVECQVQRRQPLSSENIKKYILFFLKNIGEIACEVS